MLYICALKHTFNKITKIFTCYLKYIKLLILPLCCILAFSLNAIAKNATDSNSVDDKNEHVDTSRMQAVRIHYRVNRTTIERDYMNNAQALRTLDHIFTEHPASDIAYIVIMGSASSEGPKQNNDRLAEQRTLSLKNYILANYSGFNKEQIITIPRGENWDGLESMVEDGKNIPYRDEILHILRSGISREEKKKRMVAIGNGRAYKYLQEHILPHLRGGVSSMIYFKEKLVVNTIETVRVDTIYQEKTVYEEKIVYVSDTTANRQRKPFFIAIKNNLLYDAALLPNLSIEVPFGKGYKWSAAIEGNWSWWNTGASKYNYHRIQMAGVEVRRWFRRNSVNPLNGWYAGVYGYGGDYDIRLFASKKSDVGQQSRRSYSAGLTFGYAIPIGWRFNLEFGVGLGYFGGEYKKYYVCDCEDGVFPVLGTYSRSYFGLTKASISLVWQIGSGINENNAKVNSRKGVEPW